MARPNYYYVIEEDGVISFMGDNRNEFINKLCSIKNKIVKVQIRNR